MMGFVSRMWGAVVARWAAFVEADEALRGTYVHVGTVVNGHVVYAVPVTVTV